MDQRVAQNKYTAAKYLLKLAQCTKYTPKSTVKNCTFLQNYTKNYLYLVDFRCKIMLKLLINKKLNRAVGRIYGDYYGDI